MEALALTDRDGVYGAVKFAKACRRSRGAADPRGGPGGGPAVDAALARPLAARWGRGPAGPPGPRSAAGPASTRGMPAGHRPGPRPAPAGRSLCRLVSAPPTCAASAARRCSSLALVAEHASRG